MEYQTYLIINVVKLIVTVSLPTMAFYVSVTDTRAGVERTKEAGNLK